MRHARFRAQNLALGLRVGISHAHPHQKSIELRLGQRIRTVVLHRILGRDHQKRLRQFVRMRVDGNLAFVHGLEQRRLRLRRGAVDFVGQQDVGEHRAALEFEFVFERRINRNADHVGGQHVAGELHALKGAIDGAGQRLSERGLAHAGNAFNQQVSAGENADQREPNHVVLTANHAAEGGFEFGGFMRNGGNGLGRHSFSILLFGAARAELRTSCGLAVCF